MVSKAQEKTKAKRLVKTKARKKVASKFTAPLYNQKGELLKKIILPEKIFGQKPDQKLLAIATRVYLSNQKPVLAATKTRGVVAGGGAKPWRQKGTGRARAGSIRSPGRRGGGVVFGPAPSARSLKLTKKMRQKALVAALSEKVADSSIILIDKFGFREPKTKKAYEFLKKIGVENKKKISVVLNDKDPVVEKSFRNLPGVWLSRAVDLNAASVLKFSGLIFTLDSLEKLKERLEKNRSQSN
ncbi:MAG: 50S ribosomal protein L4 [bacterium]|nr:50S ribosomal protein L4 [bacterium]